MKKTRRTINKHWIWGAPLRVRNSLGLLFLFRRHEILIVHDLKKRLYHLYIAQILVEFSVLVKCKVYPFVFAKFLFRLQLLIRRILLLIVHYFFRLGSEFCHIKVSI